MPTDRRSPGPSSKGAARRARAEQVRQSVAQRQRRTRATGIVLAVVAVIGALVLSSIIIGHGKPKSGAQRLTAPGSVVASATGVPVSTLDAVGAGTAQNDPADLSGQDLPTTGKPEVLYIGAEWCPYCAAERWPMVVALSRFGTFANLGTTESSPSDSYPRTPTFSFHGATYTSSYLDFVAKEVYSNQVSKSKYELLDTLTADQKSLFAKGGGGFPYLNVGGKYRVGVQYDPGVLRGNTMEQIAASLSDASSPIARAVDGSANILTAALCNITSQQPAAVCTTTTITSLQSHVGAKR